MCIVTREQTQKLMFSLPCNPEFFLSLILLSNGMKSFSMTENVSEKNRKLSKLFTDGAFRRIKFFKNVMRKSVENFVYWIRFFNENI
jgi:hypothetical protein